MHRDTFARMSLGIDLSALPVVVAGPGVEIRGTEAGELTVALVRLDAGHDARPLFRGLENDLCQCPHWGYVIRGRLRIWTSADTFELCEAGQAFYWPPGHAPEALEDSEFLELSPTDELRVLQEHVATVVAGG
jgi:hypothetical protein